MESNICHIVLDMCKILVYNNKVDINYLGQILIFLCVYIN